MTYNLTGQKIFVGSSGAEEAFRDTALRLLQSYNERVRETHLFLEVCDYRELYLDQIPIQKCINARIRDCDLIILIFGNRIGAGLAEEYRLAIELYNNSEITNFLLYFLRGPQATTDQERIEMGVLREFKQKIEKAGIPYSDVQDAEEFRLRLSQHISQWLDAERQTSDALGGFIHDVFFQRLMIRHPHYTPEMVAWNALDDSDPGLARLAEAAYTKYIHGRTADSGQMSERESYLIARFLRKAILNNRFQVCEPREFSNPIHQYLADLTHGADAGIRKRVTDRLVEWLKSRQSVTEVPRNFAAFELGMLQARHAGPLLTFAVNDPEEFPSVRIYAAMALAMIGQRCHLPSLIRAYRNENSSEVRNQIAEAVLYMSSVKGEHYD